MIACAVSRHDWAKRRDIWADPVWYWTCATDGGGKTVEPTHPPEPLDAAAEPAERAVQVLATMVRIHDVSIERPDVVVYLEAIAPEKQEIALIHAIEVGITELVARRARFRPQ